MSSEDNRKMAAILHTAYLENQTFSDSCLGKLSLENAYLVQFELARLREGDGEQLSGWKVGLTSKAMQEQQGMHEPCLGHLLQSGEIASPAQFSFDELILPGFENELCMRLKSPLSGTNVSFDEALAAIGEIAPALEIIEKRSDFRVDFPLAIAGNAQQKSFVTGAFVPISPDLDLAKIKAVIEVNGQIQETAASDKVLGNPVNSLIWLAGKLSEYNRVLEAGDLIMSGSFTKQYAVAAGDVVRTRFEGIGMVESSFI